VILVRLLFCTFGLDPPLFFAGHPTCRVSHFWCFHPPCYSRHLFFYIICCFPLSFACRHSNGSLLLPNLLRPNRQGLRYWFCPCAKPITVFCFSPLVAWVCGVSAAFLFPSVSVGPPPPPPPLTIFFHPSVQSPFAPSQNTPHQPPPSHPHVFVHRVIKFSKSIPTFFLFFFPITGFHPPPPPYPAFPGVV